MTPERLRVLQQVNQALIENGDLCNFDDLVDLARARRVQVWDRPHSLVVTEVIAYPQRRVLNTIVAAGRLEEIMTLERQVEDFARAQDCSLMLAHGRPAWGRIGRRTGWEVHAMQYFKRLAKPNGDGR